MDAASACPYVAFIRLYLPNHERSACRVLCRRARDVFSVLCAAWLNTTGVVVVGWREEEVFQDQFSRRVLSLLARRRMFVADLAKQSRIPYPTLYGYLRQGRRVPVYAAARMASALEVSLSELAGEVLPVDRSSDTV